MDESEIQAALNEMSRQIVRDCQDPHRLLVLGIRTNGAYLARRLGTELGNSLERAPEIGELEIYGAGNEIQRISPADADLGPPNLKDREIILVDDVIYSGRTVKSALSLIFRAGRPRSVRLAVLVDRGHREVPVKPNYVGKHIPSSERDRVRVKLREGEHNEADKVVIYSIVGLAEGQPGASA
jgi:pyrimidine operon attenuation protein / uracil phosphoribosyltransferase